MPMTLYGSGSLRKDGLVSEKEIKTIRKENTCYYPCDCVGFDTS